MDLENLSKIDSLVERLLQVSRIPGAALAVVANGQIVLTKGYGLRDLQAQLPLTADTVYPIASTTKSLNATLLGMLVDEGLLAWDAPVQDYIPRFRLRDPLISMQVTLRDLVVMRTGLPRHDWLWCEHPITRAELVERLRHLEFSAGFRERYQYSNLTVVTSGHIAEVVTGQSWEDLIQQRILTPLGMTHTGFVLPTEGDVTSSYHENTLRELVPTRRLATEVTAPSGGSIHSTIADMARWVAFNMNGGRVGGRSLIQAKTLTEIQSPHITGGVQLTWPKSNASYGMGWFLDTYNELLRVSHGGYLFDVNSDVSLFPQRGIGLVSFINFGCPNLAKFINQLALDTVLGREPAETLEEKLADYEKRIKETRTRNDSVPRIPYTAPSHPVSDYSGTYTHPAYGDIRIAEQDGELVFHRYNLILPLQHWHYDAWVARDLDSDYFPIHIQHSFDRTSRFLFETNADGAIAAVSIRLEPEVPAIRFEKR